MKITENTEINSKSITVKTSSESSMAGGFFRYDEQKTIKRAEAIEALLNQLNPLRNKYNLNQADFDKVAELKERYEILLSNVEYLLSKAARK